MRLVWVRVALVLAGLVWMPAAQAATIHRIVAIGDLHGDFPAWRDIARAAGLVDAAGHWVGGTTVLVQTGDVVDRGPDSRQIIEELMRLQREARRVGGRVITLVGNHEAMNMTDDLRYVSPADFAAFADAGSSEMRDRVYAANRDAIQAAYRKSDPTMSEAAIHDAWIAANPLGRIEHQHDWHPTGPIGRWVTRNPAVVLLDGTLFVHGGLSAAYARIPIAEINRRVAASLKAQDTAPTAIINDEAGPLWYRGLAVSPAVPMPKAAAAELDQVLHAYDAQRMVIGHTPLLTGIGIVDGGRLVRIDTGISAVFRGTPSYLEILDGVLVPHAVERSVPAPKGTG